MAEIDPLCGDFARKHPKEFAKVLGRGELPEIVRVLKLMPASVAASVVARLSSSSGDAVLLSSQESSAQWLADASYEDAISLLGRMPREHCLVLVNSLADSKRRRRLLQFLRYPAHCVGALVTDVLVRLSADTPAVEALHELRALQTGKPGPIVVQHADGRYLGILDLWLLISRDPPSGPVREYASHVPAMFPETSLANAALDPNWQQHNWLPVVDHDQRVLGGVSRDRMFGATAKARTQGGSDFMAGLVTQMMRVLATLLDRILGGSAAR